MNKKVIWLINQYASTPRTGMGGRHYYFARELARQGHTVCLISGSYGHKFRDKSNQRRIFCRSEIDGFSHVRLRVLSYSNSFSKKRILNWFVFSFLLAFFTHRRLPKPDAVVYSSPSLVGFLGARHVARKLGAKLVFEVRDIWPLTLTTLGGYSRGHPFIRFLQWVEDKAYRESDYVVSNLQNSVEHMVARGLQKDKFRWIPNGFSYDEVVDPVSLDSYFSELVPRGKFIVGYIGAIGVANAMDCLLRAAQKLVDHRDIAFVIVGDGKQKSSLMESVKIVEPNNVIFIDPIPKDQVQSMLQLFDICYLGWRDEQLYDYGIGANKIPEYLVSGKPVLHSYSGACDPFAEAGSGISVPAENADEIAAGILSLKAMPEHERLEMGNQGKLHGERYYEFRQLSRELAKLVAE